MKWRTPPQRPAPTPPRPPPQRTAGSALGFLAEACETCSDLLFVGAHVAKDDTFFCNETCRKRWHGMKRRALWERHPEGCLCVECAG